MAGWGRCRNCKQPIWWGTSPYGSGKAFPFDDQDEKLSHFLSCAAQEWVQDATGARHTVGKCKACGAKVWWQTIPSGKRRPMNIEGDAASLEDCHFDTCEGESVAAGGQRIDYDQVWAQAHGRTANEPDSIAAIAGLWLANLGLSWPTTKLEVIGAFRKLSLTYHPDMGGTASDFIRIKLARDRLVELLEQVPA